MRTKFAILLITALLLSGCMMEEVRTFKVAVLDNMVLYSDFNEVFETLSVTIDGETLTPSSSLQTVDITFSNKVTSGDVEIFWNKYDENLNYLYDGSSESSIWDDDGDYIAVFGLTQFDFNSLSEMNEFLTDRGFSAYTDSSSSDSSSDYDAFTGTACESQKDNYAEVYSTNDVNNFSSACRALYSCLVNNSTGSYVDYYQQYLDACP